MTAALAITNDTVIIDDDTRAEAAEIISDARDLPIESVTVRIDGVERAIPENLRTLLLHVLKQTAVGGAVTVRTMPDELTTTVAADMIGVSRTTLTKLIAAGEVKAHKVGSHTRLKAAEVLAFRDKKQEAQRAAFDRLRQFNV